MKELLVEGQQLEEELRQIVAVKQGRSLARLRMSNTSHTGYDVDVCMMIMHIHPDKLKKNLTCFQLLAFLLSYFVSL